MKVYILTNTLINEVDSVWDDLGKLAYHLSMYRIEGGIRELRPVVATLLDGTKLIGAGGQRKKLTYMEIK